MRNTFSEASYDVPGRNFSLGRTLRNILPHLPAIATEAEPSRLHPDPHPHFVCNDKYIICTAAGSDKNLHLSITPVGQLITLTQ